MVHGQGARSVAEGVELLFPHKRHILNFEEHGMVVLCKI